MALRIPFLWTDHRPRIEFYVREGLIPRAPSESQLARAVAGMKYQAGVLGQLIFYSKHPALLFPTAAKQKFVDNPRGGGDQTPRVEATAEVTRKRAEAPALDRFLNRLFLFSPARFLAKSYFNPWETIPSSGFNTPAWCLIAHTLQTTHPPPGIWDIQVLHPDPGALDELERQVENSLRGQGLRARVNRALGCQPDHFEDLKDLIPRIRRFDYPAVPDGVEERMENVVSFLQYAGEL